MSHLLDLTSELLQHVLEEVDPESLASLSQCCRALREFIKNNRLLWRSIYLKQFDDPSREGDDSEIDWKDTLHRITALRKLAASEDVNIKRANLPSAADTIINLLNHTSPSTSSTRNTAFLTSLFTPQPNIDALLCASSLFTHAGTATQLPAADAPSRQLSAKLHVLYGLPIEPARLRSSSGGGGGGGGHPVHPYARARVYDLRQHTAGSLWGPFTADGSQRVDWEKMQAVMVVLGHALDVFSERTEGRFAPVWSSAWAGLGPRSFVSRPLVVLDGREVQGGLVPNPEARLVKEPAVPLDSVDPYEVTGTWMRVVCFLDYTDLYAFNFESGPIPADEYRPPLDTQEAIRLITLKLRVTKIEPPGEDEGQALPVVYFNGMSRSMHTSWDPNANSKIRGHVRLTPEGEIRWTTFSIFHGEERWRSEGIQVGGIRSARGILGTWFDKDYDPHGPAGPTAFWKISDDIIEDKARGAVFSMF